MWKSRSFGIEIECADLDVYRVRRQVDSLENRRSIILPGWDVKTDGSIPRLGNYDYDEDDYDYDENPFGGWDGGEGVEVTSPAYLFDTPQDDYDSPFKDIVTIVDLLEELGGKMAKVGEESTGLHVHIGSEDMLNIDKHRLLKAYGYFEDQIDRMHHTSRRHDSCTYACSIKSYASMNGLELRPGSSWTITRQVPRYVFHGYLSDGRAHDGYEMQTVETNFMQALMGTRYIKVTASTSTRGRTVEYRQGFGTFNSEWIINWIQFCQAFTTAAKENVESYHLFPQSMEGLAGYLLANLEDIDALAMIQQLAGTYNRKFKILAPAVKED